MATSTPTRIPTFTTFRPEMRYRALALGVLAVGALSAACVDRARDTPTQHTSQDAARTTAPSSHDPLVVTVPGEPHAVGFMDAGFDGGLTGEPDGALALSARTSARMDGAARGLLPAASHRAIVRSREVLRHSQSAYSDFVADAAGALERGAPDEAVTHLRHALMHQVDDADVWAKLGMAYRAAGKLERADDAFEEALRLGPNNTLALRGMAKLDVKNGRFKAATRHARRLSRLELEDARGPYLLGRAYMGQAMWAEAVDAFEESLAREPGQLWASSNLGFAALQIGRADAAAAALEVAVQHPRARAFMFNTLALAYEKQGATDKATAALVLALERQPGHVPSVLNKRRIDAMLTDAQRTALPATLASLRTALEPRAPEAPPGGDVLTAEAPALRAAAPAAPGVMGPAAKSPATVSSSTLAPTMVGTGATDMGNTDTGATPHASRAAPAPDAAR